MPLRVLIVDDEKLARSRLRRLLLDYPDLFVCGEARNGKEALVLIEKEAPDLLFLDIRMPLLSGFEMLAELENSPYIIFTTAFNEYALQAFEANTIDYLLKPIAKDKLSRAVEKVRRIFKDPGTVFPDIQKLAAEISARENRLQRFSVRAGHKVMLIAAPEVCCFKSEDKYTFLYAEKEKGIVPFTLKELEERLDPVRFLRVHRSTIINLDHIQSIEKWFAGKWKVVLENGEAVLVSVNYAGEFKRRIGL